ncbi:ATP-binding protein [Roseibium sp.]|uniref:ATP-binding protein n=1 Tax=Roseibium sp. TaxID=1936156 RepID=UPI003B5086F9
MDIKLPNDLSPMSIIRFSKFLKDVEEADEYVFDFGNQRWFPPFSMLYLASTLQDFRNRKYTTPRSSVNHENHSYASHMGFFRSFGLQHGREPGEASGSTTYVPITEVKTIDLINEAMQLREEVGTVIERHSSLLSSILTNHQSGNLKNTLTYSIREIIRNVFEHSEADSVSYCAQHWPTIEKVEVGIVDNGIGIHSSLTRNSTYDELEEHQAIQMALQPGVSGNPAAGADSNDEWANSGYGLYMTKRICENGGSFIVCSGGHGFELTNNTQTQFETDFTGTAIRLLMDTSKLTTLADSLATFREEGIAAAGSIPGANAASVSTSSMMLSTDFDNDS